MDNSFNVIELEKLIESVQMETYKPMSLVHFKRVWLQEMRRHPEYFYIDSKHGFMYRGTIVYVLEEGNSEELINEWKKLNESKN